ncbi:MAG: hypothetical protein U0350_22625 [Caldilineaceae bacterium]
MTLGVIERWLAPSQISRPSDGERLATQLSASEIKQLRARFAQQMLNQVVSWRRCLLYLTATQRAKIKQKREV